MLRDCSFIRHEILMFILAFKRHLFANYIIVLMKGFLRLAAASVYDLMLQLSSQQWPGQEAPAPSERARRFVSTQQSLFPQGPHGTEPLAPV